MLDINVHLVDNVRDLGPLYTHDCFSFEDKNYLVLSFIHGTESVASQIINAIAFSEKVPDLRFCCHSHGYDKIQQLMKGYMPKKPEEIMPQVYRLGAYTKWIISDMEASAIEDYIGYALVNTNCFGFSRLLVKDNVLIYSQDYKK